MQMHSFFLDLDLRDTYIIWIGGKMRMNEICEKIGISRKAILYYEQEELITIKRDENNYRNFSNEDIQTIELIYKLRLWNIPVAIIKQYLQTKDTAILDTYISSEKIKLTSQLASIEQFNVTDTNINFQRIEVRNYIKANIPGNFGLYLSNHYNYYFEKDQVKYQGNEQLFAAVLDYVDNHDFSALENYEIAQVPTSMQAIYYQRVAEMQSSELRNYNFVKTDNVNDIEQILIANDFYTQMVPLICKLSPSYNLLVSKLNYLEQEVNNNSN